MVAIVSVSMCLRVLEDFVYWGDRGVLYPMILLAKIALRCYLIISSAYILVSDWINDHQMNVIILINQPSNHL